MHDTGSVRLFVYHLCVYFFKIGVKFGFVFFSNLWRTSSEEKRELERLEKPMYNSVRRAAEVHRQVQFYHANVFCLN